MSFLISNAFFLTPTATNILILVGAVAISRTALRWSKQAAVLAALAACVVIVVAFVPVGDWLARPLETRFPQWREDSHTDPYGIIVLGGESGERITALAALNLRFPRAHLVYSGPGDDNSDFGSLLQIFSRHGGNPGRLTLETHSRNTYENAAYSSAMLKPFPDQSWILITFSLHMARAIGCFRHAGFKVEAYPIEADASPFDPGTPALIRFDAVVREWTAIFVYRLLGKTDALLPGP